MNNNQTTAETANGEGQEPEKAFSNPGSPVGRRGGIRRVEGVKSGDEQRAEVIKAKANKKR